MRGCIKFLIEFQNSTVNQNEIDKRKDALNNKEKWIYEEIEFLILTLERTDREEKTNIISELYKEYLNGQFTRRNLEEYCSITERLFLVDILQLRADYEYLLEEDARKANPPAGNYAYGKTSYIESQGRLLALGLLIISAQTRPRMTTNENLLEYTLSTRGRRYSQILSNIDYLGMSNEIFRGK